MAIARPNTDDVHARNLFAGSRLWIAADAFFFLSFLFAYVYLRSLDTNNMWRPPHTDPSTVLGLLTALLMVAAAGGAVVASRWAAAGRPFTLPAAVAAAAVVVAAVIQAVQLVNPGFSPSHGGAYGSVFVGFTAGYFLHLLGAAYWSETVAATAARTPGSPELAADAEGSSAFLVFLAVVMVGAFVLIYLV
jgi:heme/copper-type cytochrome/quinol oxidase subunit 3